MLYEANSYRKLLQMKPLTSVDSSFLNLSKPPVSTSATACPSIEASPSILAMHSRPTLESMPPESSTESHHLYTALTFCDCAMRSATTNTYPKPCLTMGPFERTPPVAISRLHALQNYSNSIARHGGHTMIDDLSGMETMLGAIPDNLEVLVHHAKPAAGTDEFFGAMYKTKKNIWELSLEDDYFEHCAIDPPSVDMTAKWLVKLPIHRLLLMSYRSIPTEILDVLHLMPLLDSLHVPNLEDCHDIAFSDCKMLKKLSLSRVFIGEESPKQLVQQVVDILKPTKIQQVATFLPVSWQMILRDELRVLIAPLFRRRGWREVPERVWPGLELAIQLSIQSLQQQMLNDANSFRKLLQMPLLTSVDSLAKT
ncbi:hypothetical protein BJ741DRAFT_663049 [Chytriomyces cf. hyalinus JEL632]|nr:hypothetical protein BJ741DRAFT_663049 [Chytriomyces cf. hyalinus JEL632]